MAKKEIKAPVEKEESKVKKTPVAPKQDVTEAKAPAAKTVKPKSPVKTAPEKAEINLEENKHETAETEVSLTKTEAETEVKTDKKKKKKKKYKKEKEKKAQAKKAKAQKKKKAKKKKKN